MLIDASADFNIPYVVLSSGAAIEPDAPPTFRVIGQSGSVGDGTTSVQDSGSITGGTATTPVTITSDAHGLVAGIVLFLSGIAGLTGASGAFRIANITTNTFDLVGSVGGGAYTSGGTWQIAGLYRLPFNSGLRAALAVGSTYTVLVNWTVSGTPHADQFTFTVVN